MKEITVTLPEAGKGSLVKRFLALFVPLLVALIIIAALYYRGESKTFSARMNSSETYAVDLQTYIIERNFRDILSDVIFLTGQGELQDLLVDPSPELVKAIGNEYRTFAFSKGLYDRISFIDETGKERVKVNFNNGEPQTVPENELGSVASDPVFVNSLKLRKRQVYVSPFDLSMKDGKVEKPLKPIIRFGSPVFGPDGKKRGVVILTYLGKKLIEDLRKAAMPYPGDIMLLNSSGYWLMAPTREDEWGFRSKAGGDRTFAADFPEAWSTISLQSFGQFRNRNGLFTFATIFPLIEGRRTSAGPARGDDFDLGLIQVKAYSWKVVSHVNPTILDMRASGLRKVIIPLMALLILIAGTSCWYLARAAERARRAEEAFKFQVSHDSLTGIWNRSGIIELGRRELARSKRHDTNVAIMLANVDGFKQLNTKYGHEAGDEILREVSRRISSSVRDYDSVGRYAGDEFMVVLPDCGSDQAQTVAERILSSVENTTVPVAGTSTELSLSLGIVTTQDIERDEVEDIIRRAESVLVQNRSAKAEAGT